MRLENRVMPLGEFAMTFTVRVAGLFLELRMGLLKKPLSASSRVAVKPRIESLS